VSNNLKAFIWMMGAVLSFVLMAVAGREILKEINTFELMLYRSLIGLAVVTGLIIKAPRGFKLVRTNIFRQHLLRNIFHFTGQNLWFFAIAAIPLSQLVALEFTNPLWVALLAPFLLGEALTGKKFAVVLLGFFGVLIVARPGVEPLSLGHAAGLIAALGFALNAILTRKIMRKDHVLTVLFWMTLLQSGFAFALSLQGGIPWPSAALWPWIIIVGLTGLSAHYCLTTALGLAPASVVAPMEFVRLPVIAVVGMVMYDEPIMITVFIGGAVILTANILNLRLKT
jgi:drug/metabolite transporter (DMT)-like permease